MPVAERPIRLDFDLQVLSMDKATRVVNFALRLDPNRYSEAMLDDGTRAWYDRFDDLYITQSAIEDLAALQLPGSPIGLQLQKAGRLDAYVGDCRARIVAALEGALPSAECADMSEEWLRSRAGDELGFAILSLISLARQGFRRSLTALAMRDYRSFSKASFLRSYLFSGVMSSSTQATGSLPTFPNRALSSKMTSPVNVPSTCEPLLLTRSTLCSRMSGCHRLRFGSE
jgi:hypothetical protein